MIESAERSFGPLAVLVNNAGPEYFPREPLEHWADMIQIDLLGTAFATRHAIEAMRRHRDGGAIVNMTSISALSFGGEEAADVPAYDACKAGIMRLTACLAGLAGSDGIRVNCLAPGWIASHGPREYWESLTPQERKDQGVPSRLLSVDEIAGAIFRLATDETLAGRVMVWHSEDVPRLIPFGDRGYESLETPPLTL
jgi:NAD(P)-dependent dehydrogenase (short-subunit alcohol dehydrogenase family)